MSVKKADRILNELRINCEHDAANLIEQLQQRVVEIENKYEGKDIVWFEREEVSALDPEQTGLVSLSEVRARAVEEFADNFNGDNSEWVTYQAFRSSAYQHAAKIRNGEDDE